MAQLKLPFQPPIEPMLAKAATTPDKRAPLQIGYSREVAPDAARIDLASLDWQALSDGSRVAHVTIESQGASAVRIIVRHIVPMCIPSVIVRITLNMTGIILTAAGLGFLGLGAQPPTPEWGAMLSTGREYMLGSWWIAAVPGLAILIVGLAFSLFGDGLRDVLDPRHD